MTDPEAGPYFVDRDSESTLTSGYVDGIGKFRKPALLGAIGTRLTGGILRRINGANSDSPIVVAAEVCSNSLAAPRPTSQPPETSARLLGQSAVHVNQPIKYCGFASMVATTGS